MSFVEYVTGLSLNSVAATPFVTVSLLIQTFNCLIGTRSTRCSTRRGVESEWCIRQIFFPPVLLKNLHLAQIQNVLFSCSDCVTDMFQIGFTELTVLGFFPLFYFGSWVSLRLWCSPLNSVAWRDFYSTR